MCYLLLEKLNSFCILPVELFVAFAVVLAVVVAVVFTMLGVVVTFPVVFVFAIKYDVVILLTAELLVSLNKKSKVLNVQWFK